MTKLGLSTSFVLESRVTGSLLLGDKGMVVTDRVGVTGRGVTEVFTIGEGEIFTIVVATMETATASRMVGV